MSKIEFPLRIQIFPKTIKLTVLQYLRALDTKRKSIFDISKIAEDEVHGVSFHNHLVARCHIKNWWRGAVPKTALATGGGAGPRQKPRRDSSRIYSLLVPVH